MFSSRSFSSFPLKFSENEVQNTHNLHSFVHSDEIWSINKINHEIVPHLMDHIFRLKSRFSASKTDDEREVLDLQRHLVVIQEDFLYVKDILRKLSEMEKLVNEQIRALLLPNLRYIKIELEEACKGEESSEAAAHSMEQTESQRSHVDSIPIRPAQILIPGMKNAVSELKRTLNLFSLNEEHKNEGEPPAEEKQQIPANADSGALSTGALPTPIEGERQEVDVETDADGLQVRTVASLRIPASDLNFRTFFTYFAQKYHCLDITSKVCLLSLCVFPENSTVRESALRYWWVGEDLIPSGTSAEMFVPELIGRFAYMGFIEPVIKESEGLAKTKFRMIPSARLALIILAKEERLFDMDLQGNFQADSLSVFNKAILQRTNQKSSQYVLRNQDPKNLETLFNINESLVDMQRYWLSRAKNLCVLQLGCWESSSERNIEVTNTDFLKSFANLKCLRYLSLRQISGIHELPSVSHLHELRILDLRACHNLTKVSEEIGSLKKLTHLDMSECYLIESMPAVLATLSELQVLKGFVVADSEVEGVCQLHDLTALTNLRKLSIYTTRRKIDSDLQYCLGNLKELQSLTITWIEVPRPSAPSGKTSHKGKLLERLVSRNQNDWRKLRFPLRVTKGSKTSRDGGNQLSAAVKAVRFPRRLEPSAPSELKKLDLRCYPLPTLPYWINPDSLPHLKKLYIRGGQLCCLKETLSESHEWKVEVMRLKFLAELRMNWEELRFCFPRLNHVEKIGCPKLTFFPCNGYGVWTKKNRL